MGKRREPRVSVDSSARVTVLGENPRTIDGRVVNASGRGLRLLLNSPLPVGAAVQVELGQTMLLGEVCYAVPEVRSYAVGLELDQMLSGLSELARQVDTLLEAPHSAPARRE